MKKEIEKKFAFMQLSPHSPAEIYLDNKNYHNSEQPLKGFEWVVYTIENNKRKRIYNADYWNEAKQWCLKENYDFLDDDPSEQLLNGIIYYIKNYYKRPTNV